MSSVKDLSGNAPLLTPFFESEQSSVTTLLFTKGFVELSSAGFVSPRYLDDDTNSGKGFPLGDYSTVVVEYEAIGTGGAVVYEQTLDPEGLVGWQAVVGMNYAGGGAFPTSTSLTTAGMYVFPALGCRMRIRVTALTTGSIRVRAALLTSVLPPPQMSTVVAVARDTQPTANVNGTIASMLMSRGGSLVVETGGPGAFQTLYSATLGTTTETQFVAVNATARHKLTSLYIKNDDTISHTYTIREGIAGNVFRTKTLAAGADWEAILPDGGVWGSAQNRTWTWQVDTVQTTNPSRCVATLQTLAQGS